MSFESALEMPRGATILFSVDQAGPIQPRVCVCVCVLVPIRFGCEVNLLLDHYSRMRIGDVIDSAVYATLDDFCVVKQNRVCSFRQLHSSSILLNAPRRAVLCGGVSKGGQHVRDRVRFVLLSTCELECGTVLSLIHSECCMIVTFVLCILRFFEKFVS